jgi:hypothetical protein
MLWGALVMLPIILGYTAYVYWLFRAKVIRRCRLSLKARPKTASRSGRWARSLLWFAVLWVAGSRAVAAVAYALRALIL